MTLKAGFSKVSKPIQSLQTQGQNNEINLKLIKDFWYVIFFIIIIILITI